MSKYKLRVTIEADDCYDLNFNLQDVADWYVKWGDLHVKHQLGDEEYKVYEADEKAEDNMEAYKYPALYMLLADGEIYEKRDINFEVFYLNE